MAQSKMINDYQTIQIAWICGSVSKCITARHSGGPSFRDLGPPFRGSAIPGSVRQSDVCLWSSKVIEPRVDDKKHASKLCDGLPEEWSTDLSSMCCAWKIGNSHKVTSSIGRPTRNSSVEINLQLLVILHFLVRHQQEVRSLFSTGRLHLERRYDSMCRFWFCTGSAYIWGPIYKTSYDKLRKNLG